MKQKEVDAKDKTAYESVFIHLNTNQITPNSAFSTM